MRKTILFAACIILVNISFGQSKVSVDSITSHIGERAVVCSKVIIGEDKIVVTKPDDISVQ